MKAKMIEILTHIFKSFNNCFLKLCVKEIAEVADFKPLSNLFHSDGPKYEILFCPVLDFFKGISNAVCDRRVLYIFREGNPNFLSLL